jgi:SAM-dependent methyltransferase
MNDRIREWDERFARGDELHGGVASPPLPAAVEGAPPGLALDLACGAGRHAIFLAERGWRVQALDGSRNAIDRMMTEARVRGVADRIEARVADLEAAGFALDLPAYDLVCDFYFLHRPLFEPIRRAVRPGGRFAAALHVRSAPEEKGRFLLDPGELRAAFADWTILHHREGASAEGGHKHWTAELIARRP